LRMLEHQVHHRADPGGRAHLYGRPEPTRNHLRIDLADIALLAQLALLEPGHGRIHDDHVLQRLRHGILEDALERSAVLIEFQIVHEQPHLLAVARIADGLVVHALALRPAVLCQRPEPARGVERLVESAVDLDLLEAFEWTHLAKPAIDYRLARIAVLVDESL